MIFKFGDQLLPVEMEEWEADPGPGGFYYRFKTRGYGAGKSRYYL